MANDSNALTAARVNKKDEFYTNYNDICLEIPHYGNVWQNKIVYCNCDNHDSAFVRFFISHFDILKLCAIVSTGYRENSHGDILLKGKDIFGYGLTENEGSYDDTTHLELLDMCDIVVTNPPFSKFRNYLRTLVNHNKKFLLIGNVNVITNKEIFSLIKDGKLWFGATIHSGDREFRVPADYPLNATGVRQDDSGNKFVRVKGVRWFTNLQHDYKPTLLLTKTMATADYQRYDNYDAINVNKVSEMPTDYNGKIGVPITYLDKHDPSVFDILGLDVQMEDNPRPNKRFTIAGRETYARIIIRRKIDGIF